MKNDYQQNQTKKETMEQAEKNTANVEKGIASTRFERKLGQDIKTNVSNVISKAPVLNQLNDNLNNGGNNKSLNNPTKGMSKLTKNNTSVPNLKPTGNKIPKSNLTNDKKDGNLMPNALKRRKRGFLPSFENRIKNSENITDNSENITDNDNKDEASLDDDSIDETPSSTTNLSKVNIKQILFIVKISPLILMFFFIILFIAMIAGESNLVSNVSPIISHTMAEINASAMIVGTKYPLILSAIFAIGALVFVASTTILTISETVDSLPIFSALYCIVPS